MDHLNNNAPLHVVIVDDHIMNLMIAEHQLESLGLSFQSFTNPLKALSYLETNPCDIVLTDYCMPQMNGFELTQSIKMISTCKAYIVLSTANRIDDHFKIKGLSLGVDAYLQKPVEFFELAEIVHSLRANK